MRKALAALSENTPQTCKTASTFLFFVLSKNKATEQYSSYMAKDELEKLLLEATADENWNISNSKMMELADATYD